MASEEAGLRSWAAARPQLRVSDLVLEIAILLGIVIRAQVVLAASNFPVNDGGLFYRMVQDLLASNLSLPLQTTYNFAAIPFAYPPLGLYVAAILGQLGVPLIEVFRYLPLFVSIASLPAFYWFAREYLDDRLPAACATVVVAVLPAAFEWRIMGGGITRSFGFLFGLLALASSYRLIKQPGWKWSILTGAFGGATILSHPEATLHFALGCLLLFAFFGRTRKVLFGAAGSAVIAATISAAWWLPVLLRFGFGLVAALSGASSWAAWYLYVLALLTSLDPVTAVMAFVGLVGNRTFRLGYPLAWACAMYLVLPRSAPQFAVLVVALLAGIGLKLIYRRVLIRGPKADEAGYDPVFRFNRASVGLLAIIAVSCFMNGAYLAKAGTTKALTPEERDALRWVAEDTQPRSRFLVIEGTSFIIARNAEWLPALTQGINAVQVQGTEWLGDGLFQRRVQLDAALQKCGDKSVECLQDWEKQASIPYSYVYVLRHNQATLTRDCCSELVAALDASPGFTVVFENDAVVIFQKRE